MATKQECLKYIKHVDDTASKVMEQGYMFKYDIVISMNGETIRLGFNAESYELLKEMLENDME